MPQSLSQQQLQEQRQLQQQRITQQQLLNVKLLSMSLPELEQSVQAEIDDNPALETTTDNDIHDDSLATNNDDDISFEESQEQQERQDELNTALEHMESDDETDDSSPYSSDNGQQTNMAFGSEISFRDELNEQMSELYLSDKEKSIMEYLIGSLDNDGFLRKEISSIVDELSIYEYIDTSTEEVEHILHLLQSFDPPGIGARSLQECLHIQIEKMPPSKLRTCMLTAVERHFEWFKKMRWDKLQTALDLSDTQLVTLKEAFRHLNPRPGAALGESMGHSTQQITPDFTIYPADEQGRIAFDINMGTVPSLVISDSFTDILANYEKTSDKTLSKSDKDALIYVRRKIDQANGFISAIEKRYKTMQTTMQAIIAWQRTYFLSGEESDLRPMVLRDIANKTGLDPSTISRVSNEKYAQTPWGIVPLRFFFTENFNTKKGDELSAKVVRQALKEIIQNEDKTAPYADDILVEEMRKRGFTIARRTVAKYRNQMGIPTANIRKNQ